MEEELAEQVFALYAGGPAGDHTLSPKQMVDFLLSSEAFVPYLDEGTLAQLTMLQAVMESTLAETPCSSVQMAQFLGMEESMVKLLYAYHTALYGDTGDWRLSVRTVVNFLVKNSREFGGLLGSRELAQLRQAQKLIDGSVSGAQYTAQELADIIGMEAEQVGQLYLLSLSKREDTSGWRLSIEDFVDFAADSVLSGARVLWGAERGRSR